jgi:hypothetical protein
MLRTREAWAYAVTGRTQAFHRAAGLANLVLGDAEEAAHAARQALAIMSDARSGRARRRLRDFYRESETTDAPSIREVRDAIADRLSSSYLQLHGEAEAA